MKICNACLVSLPETEFSNHPDMPDHLFGICKLCVADKREARTETVKQQMSDHHIASYLDRHEEKRARERQIEIELSKREKRDYVQPLSFAGISDRFFRSKRERFSWRVS